MLDVRGRGLSEASATLDYSLDAQADDVIALARTLGLEALCAGGSLDGRAHCDPRRAPCTAASMSTCSSIRRCPVRGAAHIRRKLPWYVDSIALATRGADAEAMRAFCPTWTEEQLRLRAQWLHTCDERAMRASFEGFHTDDIHADLPRLAVPSLLITAERGDVVLDADVREMQALAPAFCMCACRSAGHMIPWDNEAGFYEAFGDFLGAKLV